VHIRRPKAIRPWQHVLEPVHGYLLLAERLLADGHHFASAFNFGPGDDDTWPVERIADHMAAAWGGGAKWVRDSDPGVHEAGVLRLDASKARAELGWEPQLSIETALDWTVNWYRASRQNANMQDFTCSQIQAYAALRASA
jgi:CDP-glucose 4,6-dehydratase